MRFVPAIRGFGAEADAEFEGWFQFDGVLDIEGGLQRAPRQGSEARRIGVRADGALQELLQIGERDLAVLILNKGVVGLNILEGGAEGEEMNATREGGLI